MPEIDNIIGQIAQSLDGKSPKIHAACASGTISFGGECWNPSGPPIPLRMIAYEDMVNLDK
ncbi:hypothetical protein EC844_14411 [Acinetobacter calcoaceticus]|uniref:Uncharacterized protein n=1 Tax=Acinetobacter calcoaceticus TaxID=471 RepID=A0A4R1X8R8_ACICA|nr:hypothetical protein EC844_14411 [Acinetobacter calcoaceticus]